MNKYFRAFSTPAAVTETTLYTVPTANTAIVRSLRATNQNAGSAVVSVYYYLSESSATQRLLASQTLATGTTVELLNNAASGSDFHRGGSTAPVVFTAGDVIKVYSTVVSAEFLMSYLEIDRT